MWTIKRNLQEQGKEYFQIWSIKAPQESIIIVTNKNWHILVDQYTHTWLS